MSIQLLFKTKENGKYRAVYYYKFSTNSPEFRKFFADGITGKITMTWNSFITLLDQSIKVKLMSNSIDTDISSISLGMCKKIDFSNFLKGGSFAYLERDDGKEHLEKEIDVLSLTKYMLFTPPDDFLIPAFVSLDIVNKTHDRRYCYVSFSF